MGNFIQNYSLGPKNNNFWKKFINGDKYYWILLVNELDRKECLYSIKFEENGVDAHFMVPIQDL